MNLRPPSVTVSTHTSAFKAVAFQSPAMPNSRMSLCTQSVHSFFFPPRPLRAAPHRQYWYSQEPGRYSIGRTIVATVRIATLQVVRLTTYHSQSRPISREKDNTKKYCYDRHRILGTDNRQAVLVVSRNLRYSSSTNYSCTAGCPGGSAGNLETF